MPKEVKVMISICPMIWSEVECTPIRAFDMLISFIDELKLILVPFLKWESSPMCFIFNEVLFSISKPEVKEHEDIPKKLKWLMNFYNKLILNFSYDLKWNEAYSYASFCQADII